MVFIVFFFFHYNKNLNFEEKFKTTIFFSCIKKCKKVIIHLLLIFVGAYKKLIHKIVYTNSQKTVGV